MRKVYYLTSLLLLLALISCQDKEDAAQANTGSLRLKVATDTSLSTKADEVYDAKQIAVKILDNNGAIVKQTTDWENWNGEEFQLPAGNYTIRAASNGFDGKTPAFDKPYYAGSQEVVIEKGKNVTANVVCTLANVKVSVVFSNAFRNAFKAGTVQIGNMEENAALLSFIMSDSQTEKYAYFPAKPLLWSITVKNKNDVLKMTSNTIETVAARDFIKLNFTIASSSNINIKVDETMREYNYTVGIPTTADSDFKITTGMPVNVWTKMAEVSGKLVTSDEIDPGQLSFAYRKVGEESWSTVKADVAFTTATEYTASASISELAPDTNYEYKLSYDDGSLAASGEAMLFKTGAIIALPNASFDAWSSEKVGMLQKTLWKPWASGDVSFWDTGNKGATTVGDSNSTPSDDTYRGVGKAAQLTSKYIYVKFAAGNIFSGSYLRTDGTDGVLSFGRPFSSYPTKLRVHYKYTSKLINRNGAGYDYLKDRPDSCHIYIALTDWDEPLEIRTKVTNLQLFDKNDPKVIAYAEFISGNSTTAYEELDLPLAYKYNGRTPKYIVVVASASKYGDFFTGGEGSTLFVDDFELLYEK